MSILKNILTFGVLGPEAKIKKENNQVVQPKGEAHIPSYSPDSDYFFCLKNKKKITKHNAFDITMLSYLLIGIIIILNCVYTRHRILR